MLAYNLLAAHAHFYGYLSHVFGIVSRIGDVNDFSVGICYCRFVGVVVVSVEDEVESRNLLGNDFRHVLLVFVGNDSALKTRVEDANDDVGIFGLLNDVDPFLCRTYHLVEVYSLPDIVAQPTWNGRC